MKSQRSDNFYEDIGDGLCKFFHPQQNIYFSELICTIIACFANLLSDFDGL